MFSKSAILSRWIPVCMTLLCVCSIYLFSRQNAADSTAVSSGLIRHLLGWIHGISPKDVSYHEIRQYSFLIRKMAHFSIYTLLGLCTCWTAHGFFKKYPALIAWGFCTIYAASDEFHQLFVSGRSGSFRDICIDSSGAAFGVLLITGIYCLIRRHRRKKSLQ